MLNKIYVVLFTQIPASHNSIAESSDNFFYHIHTVHKYTTAKLVDMMSLYSILATTVKYSGVFNSSLSWSCESCDTSCSDETD